MQLSGLGFRLRRWSSAVLSRLKLLAAWTVAGDRSRPVCNSVHVRPPPPHFPLRRTCPLFSPMVAGSTDGQPDFKRSPLAVDSRAAGLLIRRSRAVLLASTLLHFQRPLQITQTLVPGPGPFSQWTMSSYGHIALLRSTKYMRSWHRTSIRPLLRILLIPSCLTQVLA